MWSVKRYRSGDPSGPLPVRPRRQVRGWRSRGNRPASASACGTGTSAARAKEVDAKSVEVASVSGIGPPYRRGHNSDTTFPYAGGRAASELGSGHDFRSAPLRSSSRRMGARARFTRAAVAGTVLLTGVNGCAQVDLDQLAGSVSGPASPSAAPQSSTAPPRMVMPSALPTAQATAAAALTVSFPDLPGYTASTAARPPRAPRTGAPPLPDPRRRQPRRHPGHAPTPRPPPDAR